MARPGLEPGTPRFSVVRAKTSNARETAGNKQLRRWRAVARNTANSWRFASIRETGQVSSPDRRFRSRELDWQKLRPCTSPKTYKKLAPVFRVKARDGAGNLDATPAVKQLKIKKH
jgi:hypothetical protein